MARWSLRHTTKTSYLSLQQLPRFITEAGFQGIELSDRDLQHETESTLSEFVQQSQQFNCGVILDINCDLTTSDYEGETGIMLVCDKNYQANIDEASITDIAPSLPYLINTKVPDQMRGTEIFSDRIIVSG